MVQDVRRDGIGARVAAVLRQDAEGAVQKLLGVENNSKRIYLEGGTRNRIPDLLSRSVGYIGEVKNVKRLSFTKQLRDYASYAEAEGMRVALFVRRDTYLSQPLKEAIFSRRIELHYIPNL